MYLSNSVYTGMNIAVREKSGKITFFQGHGKVREFCIQNPFSKSMKSQKNFTFRLPQSVIEIFRVDRATIYKPSLFSVITARIIILHGQWKLLLTIVSEKSGNLFNLTICGWQPCYIHKLCRMRSIQLHIIIHTHV